MSGKSKYSIPISDLIFYSPLVHTSRKKYLEHRKKYNIPPDGFFWWPLKLVIFPSTGRVLGGVFDAWIRAFTFGCSLSSRCIDSLSPEYISSHVISTLDSSHIRLCTYVIDLRPFPLCYIHRSILSYIITYSRVMAPEFAFKLYDSYEYPDKNDWIPTAYDDFSWTYFGVCF